MEKAPTRATIVNIRKDKTHFMTQFLSFRLKSHVNSTWPSLATSCLSVLSLVLLEVEGLVTRRGFLVVRLLVGLEPRLFFLALGILVVLLTVEALGVVVAALIVVVAVVVVVVVVVVVLVVGGLVGAGVGTIFFDLETSLVLMPPLPKSE